MAKTKGAQRRNAYVTVVAGVLIIVFLTVTHASGWGNTIFAIISSVCAGNATRTLADIGFTKRADNER